MSGEWSILTSQFDMIIRFYLADDASFLGFLRYFCILD